jgi:hypothetical protein
MSTQKKTDNNRLLPFRVIEAAVAGDVDAIHKVLKHYEGYIATLSTQRLHDEYGRVYLVVDEDMRRTLETELIIKILKFDMTRAA